MILFFLMLLLLPILTAPLETAAWLTGKARRIAPPARPRTFQGKQLQIVYFTGVAGYSGEFLARREEAFLGLLQERFPDASIHRDIFPYSVENRPLNGERIFRSLWMFLHKWRLRLPNNVFDVFIVLRNIGQLLVSADPRYGCAYNEGLSQVLMQKLQPDLPTFFVAYSGGAQMAVGACGQMSGFFIQKPVLLALGGVFTDDPGIAGFHSVVQIRGSRDRWVPDLGKLLYPGLWKWQFWSSWNRFRRSGRFRRVTSSTHCHVGKCDYFGFDKSDSGTTYQEWSADLVTQSIAGSLEPSS